MGGSVSTVPLFDRAYEEERNALRIELLRRFREDPTHTEVRQKLSQLRSLLTAHPELCRTAARELKYAQQQLTCEANDTTDWAAFDELDRLYSVYETGLVLRTLMCRSAGKVACPLGHHAAVLPTITLLIDQQPVIDEEEFQEVATKRNAQIHHLSEDVKTGGEDTTEIILHDDGIDSARGHTARDSDEDPSLVTTLTTPNVRNFWPGRGPKQVEKKPVVCSVCHRVPLASDGSIAEYISSAIECSMKKHDTPDELNAIIEKGKQVTTKAAACTELGGGYHCGYCFYTICQICAPVYCQYGHTMTLYTVAEADISCSLCQKPTITSGYQCNHCQVIDGREYVLCDFCSSPKGRIAIQERMMNFVGSDLAVIQQSVSESPSAERIIREHEHRVQSRGYRSTGELFVFQRLLQVMRKKVEEEVIFTLRSRFIDRLRLEFSGVARFSESCKEYSTRKIEYTPQDYEDYLSLHKKHESLRSLESRQGCVVACTLGHAMTPFNGLPRLYEDRQYAPLSILQRKLLRRKQTHVEAAIESMKHTATTVEIRDGEIITTEDRQEEIREKLSPEETARKAALSDEHFDEDPESLDEPATVPRSGSRPGSRGCRADDVVALEQSMAAPKDMNSIVAEISYPHRLYVTCSVCQRATNSGHHCEFCEYDLCDTCTIVSCSQGHHMTLWTQGDSEETCYLCADSPLPAESVSVHDHSLVRNPPPTRTVSPYPPAATSIPYIPPPSKILIRGYRCTTCQVDICDLCTSRAGRAKVRKDWTTKLNDLVGFMRINRYRSDVAKYYAWRQTTEIIALPRLVEYVHELQVAKRQVFRQIHQEPILKKIRLLRAQVVQRADLCAIASREVQRSENYIFLNEDAARQEMKRLANILRQMILAKDVNKRQAAGVACPLGHAMITFEEEEKQFQKTTLTRAHSGKDRSNFASLGDLDDCPPLPPITDPELLEILSPAEMEAERRFQEKLSQDPLSPPSPRRGLGRHIDRVGADKGPTSGPIHVPGAITLTEEDRETKLVSVSSSAISRPASLITTAPRAIDDPRLCRVCGVSSLLKSDTPSEHIPCSGHTCTLCEYDLCANCSVMYCRLGHRMRIWTLPEAYCLICDVCKATSITSGYRCLTCSVDICDMCTTRDSRITLAMYPKKEVKRLLSLLNVARSESPTASKWLDEYDSEQELIDVDKKLRQASSMSHICEVLAKLKAIKEVVDLEIRDKLTAAKAESYALYSRDMF